MCGGQLYHRPGCSLDREAIVIEALDALRWAYAGIPLYLICPCEVGYPGVLDCRHLPDVGFARVINATRCKALGDRAAREPMIFRYLDLPVD